MTRFVGLDVSQKLTSICVVDETGRRLWRGQCGTDPEQIARVVRGHGGEDAGIGIETGPMTPWLVHELRAQGRNEGRVYAPMGRRSRTTHLLQGSEGLDVDHTHVRAASAASGHIEGGECPGGCTRAALRHLPQHPVCASATSDNPLTRNDGRVLDG
jgi:hypothetical protein